MNKRQHKKSVKKYGFKSYYNVRRYTIYNVFEFISEYNEGNIIYLIDSKRRDLKHIRGYIIFVTESPNQINYNTENDNDVKAVDLHEKCYREQMRINAKYGEENISMPSNFVLVETDMITHFKNLYCTL